VRTTVTLDDELLRRLRELAAERGISFKAAIDEVLRRGLAAQELPARRPKRFRAETFRSPFRPGVDPVKLNQLSDELEVEHDAARIRRGAP
jgi:hypothetical protein